MNNMKEIRDVLIEKTDFLKKSGYKKVVEKSEVWHTTLSYLNIEKGLAVEFELDYRDLDVFVLVTKLENNQLPKGYYIYNGKTVRVHLEKFFEDEQIKAEGLKEIKELRCKNMDRNAHKMLMLIDAYSTLLLETISAIQKWTAVEK